MSELESFLSRKTSEFVSVMPSWGQDHPIRDDDLLSGFHGKSRYYAAVAALVMGLQQLSFRRDYNLSEWSRHFETQEAARTWMLSYRGHRLLLLRACCWTA